MNHSRLLIAFCALLQSVTLIAGSPWGIMSHPLWSNKPADLEMEIKRCKEAGITCMRTDFGFGAIAGEKGKYNFTRYDNLVDKMGAAGIEILPILEGYDWEVAKKRSDAVPLYRHPEEWRAYIRAFAEHYKGKIHAYEIWNEQDGGFWKPSPNAAQYVLLLKIAFEEIKKHNLKDDLKGIPVFYGRGAWDEAKMTWKDRTLCKILQKSIAKKDPSTYEPWMQALMCAVGQTCDWTDKKYLLPLMEYLQG